MGLKFHAVDNSLPVNLGKVMIIKKKGSEFYMASLIEQALFTEDIYEIATSDRAMGGADGTLNVQPKQLADRTKFLKDTFFVAHTDLGGHNVDAVKATLEDALDNGQVDPQGGLRETKINLEFINRPRPFNNGVYSNTTQMVEDLNLIEVTTAEQDLLQSEIDIKTVGAIYQKVYPSTGDIYVGAPSLSGYGVIGEGGMFCQNPAGITMENKTNRVRLEGDIRKLVGMYNIFPVTPHDVEFPLADAEWAEDRSDLLYLRQYEAKVSGEGSTPFYIRGFANGSGIEWGSLSSEVRRGYITDATNNLYMHYTGDVYQVQYTFEVAPGATSLMALGYTRDVTDMALYHLDDYSATPLVTVNRFNQGAYHPIYNTLGTGYFAKDGNLALDDTRFTLGDAAQLLTLNNDFASWVAATGVVVASPVITGALGEEETISTTIADAVVGSKYVFSVDLKKADADLVARSIKIALVAEDASNAALVSKEIEVALGAEYGTFGVSIVAPALADHLVLKIGSGTSCNYAFNAKDALCSVDAVPKAPKHDLKGTSTSAGTFTILGSHTAAFPAGWDITISGSSDGSNSNDGVYKVSGVVYNGTDTVISVASDVVYNTGNVGSLESTLWYYVEYCYTHQSLGVGDRTTGGVLSGRSGRLDGKHHDAFSVEDFVDYREVLEATGGMRATLSTPIVSGVPAIVNETDTVTLNISNFSEDYIYNVAVDIGEFTITGGVITWIMPEVASGSIQGSLTLYVTNVEGEFSEIVSVGTRVLHVPIVGDEGVSEPNFTTDGFVSLKGADLVEGALVGSTGGDGYAVTETYYQEEGDKEWVRVQGGVSVSGGENTDLSLSGAATSTSVVGAIAAGAWRDVAAGDQLGVSVGGIDKIVELVSASLVEGVGFGEFDPVAFNAHYSLYISVTALSDTKAVVTYMNNTISNYGYACVLTIAGSVVTAGTPVAFNAHGSSWTSVTALSENKAVVTYQNNTNDYGYACVLDLPIEYTLTVATQAAAPTAATLVGNATLPSLLTYNKDTNKMTVKYQVEELAELGEVRQLAFGIGEIESGQKVDNLIVDLWRAY